MKKIAVTSVKNKFTWQSILADVNKREHDRQRQMLIGLLDWMNKVAQDNPMVFETDSEDIVDMYLQQYYEETYVKK
jgi:hypothetical protein